MQRIYYTIFLLTLFLPVLLYTQQESQPQTNSRYEIVEQTGGLATIRDKYTGSRWVKYLGKPGEQPSAYPLDTLYADTTVVINVWEIDTTQFANRFQLMGTVPLAGFYQPLLIFDSNGNDRAEIIGRYRADSMSYSTNQFYEYDPQIADFINVVDFNVRLQEKGGGAKLGSDIDKDGFKEVLFRYADSIRIYEASDSNEYAVEFRFSYNINHGAISGIGTGDFDGDDQEEILYITSVNDSSPNPPYQGSALLEHVEGDTGYINTATIPYPDGSAFGQYAIGDFDLDQKMEFLNAEVSGKVFGIENVANDSFIVHWQGQLPTWNARYNFSAGDLDGDGLPEFFIGGGHDDGFLYHSLLTAFEMAGDNQYHPFWAVDLRGGGSPLFPTQAAHGDIDGDGIDEFTIDLGGLVITFKALGDNDYRIFWVKRVSWPDGVAMGDVDGDGLSEIIIATTPVNNQGLFTKAYVYKFDSTALGIPPHQPSLPNTIILYPGYPNPFNGSTTIRYLLHKTQPITLTIYDILGKEVITLIDGRQTAGIHSIQWNGINQTGKEVSSGIYFIRLTSGKKQQVQKIVLAR